MKILHILRSPVGGLFRHVIDLAEGQIARGHAVGIIADSRTGNVLSERLLAAFAPRLALGLSRTAVPRKPGPRDVAALLHIARRVQQTHADVVHGHGAKGGGLARLVPTLHPVLRVYTPHGGSLHDAVGSEVHIVMERMLRHRSDLCVFESAYSAEMYARKVGAPSGLMRIVYNGVRRIEFVPVALACDATDFVFLGEMRDIKGVDVLIEALATLARTGRPLTATLVGGGAQAADYWARAAALGLEGQVRFTGPLPTREALSLGRCVVLPSRAESLPYVILEAAAAGKPLIATHVGGIPEIFGPYADVLIVPGDVTALAGALQDAVDAADTLELRARQLRQRVEQGFAVDAMVDGVLASYAEALAPRCGAPVPQQLYVPSNMRTH